LEKSGAKLFSIFIIGVEYASAHGPDLKKSLYFAPRVPVFLQKKKRLPATDLT
jgi:hypothetical protein